MSPTLCLIPSTCSPSLPWCRQPRLPIPFLYFPNPSLYSGSFRLSVSCSAIASCPLRRKNFHHGTGGDGCALASLLDIHHPLFDNQFTPAQSHEPSCFTPLIPVNTEQEGVCLPDLHHLNLTCCWTNYINTYT